MKTYSHKQFNLSYPDDNSCIEEIWRNRYGQMKYCPSCGTQATFYRLKSRKTYSCKDCRFQINPLSGTIFHKSSTSLKDWFYAIYLFSVSKNGVSAMELQRHLGVTYKCAWRIARQIRTLMDQDTQRLSAVVEGDETYIGGKHRVVHGFSKKTPVLGLVERQGHVRALVTDTASATRARAFIQANLTSEAELHTDESTIYKHVKDRPHFTINHKRGEYSKHGISTNTIEGFWGQMKRSLDGTYHTVSPKYLQLYVNEFVYRYNHRGVIYPLLLEAASKPV